MKFKVYQAFFLVGILFELIAQIIFRFGITWNKPIDFPHWFLLLGVVFMIPQVISFPDKIYSYVGIPVMLAAITGAIGMCVIDFTFWSYQTDYEARDAFYAHISKVPIIWKPFMRIGPNLINWGLLLLSLNYLDSKACRWGVFVIIFATILTKMPIPYRLVFVYAFTLVGYGIIFYRNKQAT